MTAKILAFARRSLGLPSPGPGGDWSPQDLAELYRIRDQLSAAGLSVRLSTGQTDEAEPWAAFDHRHTGEVFVHVARLDGRLVVVNAVTFASYQGRDFRSVADQLLADAPVSLAPAAHGDNKISVHPRSVFVAFIAATMAVAEYLHTMGKAQAAEAPSFDAKVAAGRELFGGVFDRVLGRDAALPSLVTANASMAGVLSVAIAAFALSQTIEVADATLTAEPETVSAQHAQSAGAKSEQPAVVSDIGHEAQGSVASEPLPQEVPPAVTDMVPAQPLLQEGLPKFEPPLVSFLEPADTSVRLRLATLDRPDLMGSGGYDQGRLIGEMITSVSDGSPQQAPSEAAASRASLVLSLLEPTAITAQELRAIETVLQKHETSEAERIREPAAEAGVTSIQQSSAPSIAVITGQEFNEKLVFHFAPSQAAVATMKSGRTDIIVFNDHDITVTNFRFGEDVIFAGGSLDKATWIRTIEVVADDVILTGIQGGRIILIDAYPSIV